MLETDTKGDIVYIALTDINGNAILRDERNDSTLQNKLYTGHKYDNVTGLTYAHARYLDTRTHTFTTVDPLYYQLSSAQLYNPQLMNAYSYANNNPVSNTDPTGLRSISAAYNSVKSAVSSAISSVKSAVSSVVSSIKSAGSSASSLVSSASTYVSNNAKPAAMALYSSVAGGVASIANTAIGMYNIASIANSFSISGAISNYASTGSLMPTLAPSLNAGSFGITNPTNVTQFNSAKLGGDIALIFGPAAVEMAGSKVVSASKSVWTGTNMSVGDSMAYHLSKHGNGLSMGEYTEKALDFFGRYLKNSEGLRIKSVDLKTSPITSGLKISDPATGEAGIYDSLGKIVTYILPK